MQPLWLYIQPLRLYMQAGALYMRDIGWSPDFRIVGASASDLYYLDNDARPNAVISVTQWALVRLVSALGGIETSNGFLAADQVIPNIESQTDEIGTDYLGVLMDDLLHGLSGEALAQKPLEIMLALNQMLITKEVMIWVESDVVQAELEKNGWSGKLPDASTDRLVVVDSNIGWNKVDRNIRRTLNYEVDLSELAKPSAAIRIEYENLSGDTARSCELHGPYLEKNTYVARKEGCYWNYVRIYPPGVVNLITADQLLLPDGVTPVRANSVAEGTPSFVEVFDEAGLHFAGVVYVDPGGTSIFNIEYELPAGLVRIDSTSLSYNLRYFHQSGMRQRTVLVSVRMPNGFIPDEATLQLADKFDGTTLHFSLDGTQDQVLAVKGDILAVE